MASTSHRGQGGAYTVTPPAASGFLNVKDYGALGDGASDDRAAITTALTAAVAGSYAGLYFPKGTYIVSRNSSNNTGIDVNGLTGVAFVGCGWQSVIKMQATFADDYNLVRLRNGSTRISFQDLTFDGNWTDEAGNEQIHLLVCGVGEATGTVSNVDIQHCWFKNAKGDGVRLLGADSGGEVTNVRITDCRFTDNNRCGIAVQRGTYDIHVTNNFFSGGVGQQLDMEASSASGVGRYVIHGNTFDGTNDVDSRQLVTIGGYSDVVPNVNTVFSNNVVRGRMLLTNNTGLRFTGNTIVPGAEASDEATCNFIRVCKDVVVSGNHFERAAGTTNGLVVQFSQANSLAPSGVVFANNTVVNNVDGDCLNFDSADNVVVADNIIKFFGTSTSSYKGIGFDAILANLESITVTGNTVLGNLGGGSLAYGISVNARDRAIARTVISGNTVKSAITGINVQKAAGSFTTFPVVTGNSLSSCTEAVSHSSQTVLIGGQHGGVVTLFGSSSPESAVAAPVGSVFYRDDGGAGTCKYTKESGTSTTGWVADGAVVVANDSITFAKMQNITSDRLIGRDTASSGDPEEISVGGGLEFTGSGGIQRSALTGDVTASAGSGSTTIANDAVTYAKIQDVTATSRLLGRITSGSGIVEELTGTQATTLLDLATAALKGLAPAYPNNTTTFLRGDGSYAAPVRKLFLYYGGAAMTAGDSDRYANPVGYSTSPLGTTGVFYTVPVSGNLVAIQYQVGTAHTTNTVTIAPRLNSVEQTTQKITIAATTLYQRSTLGTPLAVAVGDVLACQMDHTGATNLAFINICFEIEF